MKKKKIFGVLGVAVMLCINASYAKAEIYRYDELNRVIKVIYENGSYIEYKYDSNGNMIDTIVYVPEELQVTQKPSATPTPSATLTPQATATPVVPSATPTPKATATPVVPSATPTPEDGEKPAPPKEDSVGRFGTFTKEIEEVIEDTRQQKPFDGGIYRDEGRRGLQGNV